MSSSTELCFRFENEDKYNLLAGVDEAGRGPLAGDVVAAAVILDPNNVPAGLADSKQLSEVRRNTLFSEIVENAVCYGVGRSSVIEIDRFNILRASLLAMERAVSVMAEQPDFVYVDGNKLPPWAFPSLAVVKGDSKLVSVAAASILAKVIRDKEMVALDEKYPGYGFAQHKGYPTKNHREALEKLGPSVIHRKSFAPVAKLLKQKR